MKGILLLSHGNMAKGMLQTSSVFFGDNYEQIQALDFQITDSADEFEEKIGKAIEELDTGEGVIILTDLFAGTPAHKSTKFIGEGVQVICGMNLPMLLELLGARMCGEIDLAVIMEAGKNGICPWDPQNVSSEDDFF